MTNLYLFDYKKENFENSIIIYNSNNLNTCNLYDFFCNLYFFNREKNSYLITFNLNLFYTLLKNIKQHLYLLKKFEFNNIIYCLEIRDLREKRKIIIKDYYNFIDQLMVKDLSFIEKATIFKQLLQELEVEFNISLENSYILSSASIGFKIFKTKYFLRYKLIEKLNPVTDEYIRKSFFGGRNEIFKPVYRKESFYYDINSLYPFIMKTQQFPIGEASYCTKEFFNQEFNLNTYYGFIDVLVSVDKSLNIPILPYKLQQTNIKPGMGIIYPLGVFRTIYYSEELKYAIKNGYKIIEIYSGYKYEKMSLIFNDFVTLLYDKRLQAKDTVIKSFYKRCLNSVFGRLASSFEEIHKDTDTDTEIVISPDTEDFIYASYKTRYNNVGIASAIAAYSRIYMYDIIVSNNLEPIYWDTDGLFLTKALPSKLISKETIGLFRLISHNKEVYFISGKFYLYKTVADSSKFISVLRGVSTSYKIYNYFELLYNFNLRLQEASMNKSFTLSINFLTNLNQVQVMTFTFVKKRKYIYDKTKHKLITKPWIVCLS